MKILKLFCLLAALSVTADSLRAQTPPVLGIQLYAGVNITGTVGDVYRIECTTNLNQSNAWTCLTFLQLSVTNYLWVDPGTPASARRFYRAVRQTAPTNMVYIAPGTFKLGSPTNEFGRSLDEGPQTTVTLTHGYWIGVHEVTQGEYISVTSTNPSFFTSNVNFLNFPVDSVSWPDATNFCALLTQQELAAGRIAPGTEYRLPTEAEWEYAARAGTSTRFSYGDDPLATSLTNYAWSAGSGGLTSHQVAQKLPNQLGMYDTMGNVYEWCSDWYDGPYPGGFQTDPKGPPSSFQGVKVIRGGAFDDGTCRIAERRTKGNHPAITDYNLGMRVVLAPVP